MGEGLNKTKISVSPSEGKDEERKCVEKRTSCNGDKSLSWNQLWKPWEIRKSSKIYGHRVSEDRRNGEVEEVRTGLKIRVYTRNGSYLHRAPCIWMVAKCAAEMVTSLLWLQWKQWTHTRAEGNLSMKVKIRKTSAMVECLHDMPKVLDSGQAVQRTMKKRKGLLKKHRARCADIHRQSQQVRGRDMQISLSSKLVYIVS